MHSAIGNTARFMEAPNDKSNFIVKNGYNSILSSDFKFRIRHGLKTGVVIIVALLSCLFLKKQGLIVGDMS